MSFIKDIPKHHAAMVAALKPLDTKISDVAFKLDAHYEAEEKGSHECDCEYCPYGDVDSKDILDDLELEELERSRTKAEAERAEQVLAIKRLENYAAFVKHPLPKEVLIK